MAPPDSSNVLPGEIRRAGELQVDVMGTAIITGTEIHQFLSGRDNRQLITLRGDIKRVITDVADPLSPGDRISLMVSQRRKPRMRVTRQGDQVKVDLDLVYTAQMQGQESTIDYSDPQRHRHLEEAVSRELAQAYTELMNRAFKEWEVDLLMVGNRLKRTFLTYSDWIRWDWPSKIAKTKSSVKVTFRVERFGFLNSPPPVSR